MRFYTEYEQTYPESLEQTNKMGEMALNGL